MAEHGAILMFLGGVAITDQVLGLVLNGLALAALGGIGWLLKRGLAVARNTLQTVEHLDECLDSTRETIRQHLKEADARDRKISALESELAAEHGQRLALEAYLRGLHNMAIDAPMSALKPGEMG